VFDTVQECTYNIYKASFSPCSVQQIKTFCIYNKLLRILLRLRKSKEERSVPCVVTILLLWVRSAPALPPASNLSCRYSYISVKCRFHIIFWPETFHCSSEASVRHAHLRSSHGSYKYPHRIQGHLIAILEWIHIRVKIIHQLLVIMNTRLTNALMYMWPSLDSWTPSRGSLVSMTFAQCEFVVNR
jgi:hypothetical protein